MSKLAPDEAAGISVETLGPSTQMSPGVIGFARASWERWMQIAHAIGVVQTRILMVIFYFVLVFPLGLILKRTGDPLHLRQPRDSNWTPHHHETPSLETARRQF